jgi:LCP family protein required for cell wall assembly
MPAVRASSIGLGRGGRPLGARAFAAAIIAIALALGACDSPTPSTSVALPSPSPSIALPTATPSPTAPPATTAPTMPPDPLLGLDGRFTLLLLGSDYRPAHPGNRTDAIMVVSISPADGSVSAVSIPRDTARFPLPDGSVYETKINSLYQATIARVGRAASGREIEHIIGSGLGVEIDAYALIGMAGVTDLVNSIGGVDVVLDATVHDPYYWVNGHTQGVTFPAGKNHLNGDRALIFARTRKGDSDFQRVRRQQLLVLATVEKVLHRGLASLPALLKLGEKWVKTDLPLDQATEIFELIAAADFKGVRRDVLGPRYATKIPGSVNYELKLAKVRALIADWFAPVPGSPLAPATPASESSTGAPPTSPLSP